MPLFLFWLVTVCIIGFIGVVVFRAIAGPRPPLRSGERNAIEIAAREQALRDLGAQLAADMLHYRNEMCPAASDVLDILAVELCELGSIHRDDLVRMWRGGRPDPVELRAQRAAEDASVLFATRRRLLVALGDELIDGDDKTLLGLSMESRRTVCTFLAQFIDGFAKGERVALRHFYLGAPNTHPTGETWEVGEGVFDDIAEKSTTPGIVEPRARQNG